MEGARENKELPLITIEVGGTSSTPYKSIDHIVWSRIPGFSVLTGLNGSGKSQLLEVLAYGLSQTTNPYTGKPVTTIVSVTGDTFLPDSIAYVSSAGVQSGSSAVSLAQLQQAKHNLYQNLRNHSATMGNMALKSKRSRLEKLIGTNINSLDEASFIARLPDDFAFMLEEADVIPGLTHVFVAYRLQFLHLLEQRKSELAIKAELGPAPWDLVNEALKIADFPYEVVSPQKANLLDEYILRVEDRTSHKVLLATDLSSGEKVLLQLVLWLYNSKHHGVFPKLLLLDEPDAHLHPSMTRQFMDVVKELLVGRYGVRVIMSTHSPSTVALAPPGSVFEMARVSPRIRIPKSREAAVGLLTAGIVPATSSTRYVFVEGDSDVIFYDAVREILTDFGPSKDPMALMPSPSLVFLPVSIGDGKQKSGGGKAAVTDWIEKFNSQPLNELFRGLIDLDDGNTGNQRILVLRRYSIENYLVDPFVLLGLLIGDGDAWATKLLGISQGDEHLLRSLSNSIMQSAVDQVGIKAEGTMPSLKSPVRPPIRVRFTNGAEVHYPNWMIERRGRDLLPTYQTIFGGPRAISFPKMENAFRRVRLIPIELAEIMQNLQCQ